MATDIKKNIVRLDIPAKNNMNISDQQRFFKLAIHPPIKPSNPSFSLSEKLVVHVTLG